MEVRRIHVNCGEETLGRFKDEGDDPQACESVQ